MRRALRPCPPGPERPYRPRARSAAARTSGANARSPRSVAPAALPLLQALLERVGVGCLELTVGVGLGELGLARGRRSVRHVRRVGGAARRAGVLEVGREIGPL